MARPGLDKDLKFRRLVRLLGEPRSHARGYLECLWDVAYENGRARIGDAESVALAADFPGEPRKLVDALLSCGGRGRRGFIELVEGKRGEYQVHDLFDHAPDYVRRRMIREEERKDRGQTITDVRAEAARKRWEKSNASDGRLDANDSNRPPLAECRDANGATPAPAPAPAPIGGLPSPKPPGGAGEPPPAAKPRKRSTAGHQRAVDAFCDAWREKYGEKYLFNGGKDGDAVQVMLNHVGGDVERFRAVVATYLADDADRVAVDSRHSLGVLRSQFSRWLVPPKGGPPGPGARGNADTFEAKMRDAGYG